MASMRTMAAAAVVAAQVLAPVAARAARGEKTGITGRVLEAGGRTPIAGAAVAATSAGGTFTAVTGAKGSYAVVAPAGDYVVRCAADGFNAAYRSATVRSSSAVLDFALMPTLATTGTLQGVVTGPAGPIAGAAVSSTGGEVAAITDALGRFSAPAAAGTYELEAAAAGHLTGRRLVTLTPAQAATADFALALAGTVITGLTASPPAFLEGQAARIELEATVSGSLAAASWTQVGGPRVPLVAIDGVHAVADVAALAIAAEATLVFDLTGYGFDGSVSVRQVAVDVAPLAITASLGDHVQIGGASTAVARLSVGGAEWALFNVGTALHATPVGMARGPVSTVVLPGAIEDLAVVEADRPYVLAALGAAGVAVVDATDPLSLAVLSVTPVEYRQDGITFTDTGGTTTTDNVISSLAGPIVALATDGTDLFLADAAYGLHRTALSNLLSPIGPAVEPDGTLRVDAEVYTLQYAGEGAWGGPRALKLHGGLLYAALGELGLGIYDPATLARVGGYSLYTDEARLEDRFGPMAISAAVGRDPVTGDPYLDGATGMPDYRQVWFEVTQVMKGDVVAPTPWADFERSGKWFYEARDVDVEVQGARTIAYVAYSLGGLVAVDVTAAPARFLGFFPAVAANGPYDTLSQPSSILPYEGAGMLKEAGTVSVDVSGTRAFAGDHFAGLVVVDGADAPELRWRGVAAPYANDTNGIANDGVPDYENVTSYDMAAQDPLDNESLPRAFFQAPALLATSELGGHGNALLVREPTALSTPGDVDVLACSGAGGFVFVDVTDLAAPEMADRFAVPAWFPTTDEIGAAPDGSPTQAIAIGHTAGVAATERVLYVADGPHGISAWSIADAAGLPSSAVHLVANTVQDEYPVSVGAATVYPPSHASRAVLDPLRPLIWATCSRNGVRRVDVGAVEAGLGAPGAPLLLPLARTDLFEHNSDFTAKALAYQDQAYDVELRGNYAWVADGSNGLTVYDVIRDPSVATSGFLVANVGAAVGMPLLGTASGVEFWADPDGDRLYAVVAAGPYGIGIVDVTDPADLRTVKVFEPIKLEDGDVGSADGQAIDVAVIGNRAYLTYDSFGVVAYEMADLVAPLPPGVDPTRIFEKRTSGEVLYDHRPEAAGRFKLQLVPGYEDVAGGAVRLAHTTQGGRLFLYVAFGEAGVLKLDFTDAAAPLLAARVDTAGEASDVAIANGRLYVADGSGGLVFFE